MKLIVRVPVTEEGLQPYLEEVAANRRWEGIETSAAILDQESGWEDLLDAFELPLVSLHSLLPGSVSRYLAEAGDVARRALLDHVKALLEKAAAIGIGCASIDLGVERPAADEAAALQVRAGMLRTILPMAEALEMTVGLPRRVPADRRGPGRDPVMLLLNEVAHRRCRLALNVYPDELPESLEARAFLRSLHVHLGVVRWHYEPLLGVRPTPAFCRDWFEALRWLGFEGLVVLCPRVTDAQHFAREMTAIEANFAEASTIE